MSKTQDDFSRFLALEALVIKSMSLDTESVFVNNERRLLQFMATKWLAKAEPAVAAGVAAFRSGHSTRAAVGTALNGWQLQIKPALVATTRASYLEAKRQILQRATGKLGPLDPTKPPLFIVRKAPKDISIEPDFGLVDEQAVAQLATSQLRWMGDYYDDELGDEIDDLVSELMVEGGLGRADAAEQLQLRLAERLGITAADIPGTWVGPVSDYFEVLAANAVTNARTRGALGQMAQVGVERYVISAVGDERTCGRCLFMDGKSRLVADAVKTMDALNDADEPDQVRQLHPWASNVKQMEDDPDKFEFPPFHGRCRCTVDIDADSEISFEPAAGWEA